MYNKYVFICFFNKRLCQWKKGICRYNFLVKHNTRDTNATRANINIKNIIRAKKLFLKSHITFCRIFLIGGDAPRVLRYVVMVTEKYIACTFFV